jgi:hypothetical protein
MDLFYEHGSVSVCTCVFITSLIETSDGNLINFVRKFFHYTETYYCNLYVSIFSSTNMPVIQPVPLLECKSRNLEFCLLAEFKQFCKLC